MHRQSHADTAVSFHSFIYLFLLFIILFSSALIKDTPQTAGKKKKKGSTNAHRAQKCQD